LHEQISIHDKFQFELKYTYPFDRTSAELDYITETYIFIPNNLGVNQDTYGKREFYNDIQKYIRFKTPVFQLASINKPDGPVAQLKLTVTKMLELNTRPDTDYTYHLKMLCSILKSALRDEEVYVEQQQSEETKLTAANEYIKHTLKIIAEFRKLRPLLETPSASGTPLTLFNFADEYISMLVEKSLFSLMQCVKRDSAEQELVCAAALTAINAEITYRLSRNYPSIVRENNSNEEVIYRMRTLKKIMGSILLLKTHTHLEGRWFEQLLMGIAAGLSMAFATGMVFLSRQVFADLTISIFIILVISYIFKDRIKELSKLFLLESARHFFYDYKTILMTNLTKIGYCRESFVFVKENNLPPEIVRIRNKNYFSELENGFLGENVINYKKTIKILPCNCSSLLTDFQVDGLNDIVRFNIRHYLDKMDDAEKLLPIPEGSSSLKMVRGNNVYQINMVLKYAHGAEIEYRKFRITLDRTGLKRLTELPCPV
jgi:hypothetical protein